MSSFSALDWVGPFSEALSRLGIPNSSTLAAVLITAFVLLYLSYSVNSYQNRLRLGTETTLPHGH